MTLESTNINITKILVNARDIEDEIKDQDGRTVR